eukprot:RCo051681
MVTRLNKKLATNSPMRSLCTDTHPPTDTPIHSLSHIQAKNICDTGHPCMQRTREIFFTSRSAMQRWCTAERNEASGRLRFWVLGVSTKRKQGVLFWVCACAPTPTLCHFSCLPPPSSPSHWMGGSWGWLSAFFPFRELLPACAGRSSTTFHTRSTAHFFLRQPAGGPCGNHLEDFPCILF